MGNEKKLSGSMFGYKKTEVNSYITELAEKFRKEAAEKDGRISALTGENQKLAEENTELKSRISKLEADLEELEREEGVLKNQLNTLVSAVSTLDKQKEIVSSAIIKAQAEAEEIRAQAQAAAEIKISEAEQRTRSELDKAEQVKAEIAALQKIAIKTIKNFESQLNLLNEKIGNGR